MGSFIEAAKTDEFRDGMNKKVLVEGHEILLARGGDDYYAVGNRCPHMGGKLSDGKLEGTIVTCPRHSSQFDLKNGEVVRWLKGSGLISSLGKALKSPRPITTYKIEVKSDSILVEL